MKIRSNHQKRALVVGAGIAGLCIARELALLGWEVEIFEDPEAPPASRAAVGLLQVAGGRISAKHLALRRRCLEGYEAFLESINEAVGPDFFEERISSNDGRGWGTLVMRKNGHLRMTAELESLPSLRSFAATLRGLGISAEFLDCERLLGCEPSLGGVGVGAVRLEDAAVESDLLLNALGSHLEKLSVQRTTARIEEIQGRRLRTQAGRQNSGDAVVLACGAGLSEIWNPSGWAPHKDPGTRLTFEGELELVHSVELAKKAPGWTLVPGSRSRWWVGSSGSFEDEMSLGPELDALSKGGARVARNFGVRMTVGDGLPLVGGAPGTTGLYLLAGLGRNGLLTAPALAFGLAETINSGRTPDWLRPFAPDRAEVASRRPWSR